LLPEKPDAVVLLAAESDGLNALIDRHAERGASVVTVFNDAPSSRRALFVGPDHLVAGRLAAEMLGNVLTPGNRIAVLAGAPSSTHLKQRYEGFRDAFRGHDAQFCFTEYQSSEDLLSHMGTGELEFDGLYLGCPEAAELGKILGSLRRPARAVTFHLTEITKPFLESGILCAVIDSSLYSQGYLAVQKAYECIQSRSIESRWVSIPSAVMLSAHAASHSTMDFQNGVMEAVLQQRTRELYNYKRELGLANSRLLSEAETDSLTGLLNQRKFAELLGEALARSLDSTTPVALLVVAMDDAREIASLLGQSAMDQAVYAVAGALRIACSADDVLARTGPAEFAVLLTGKTLAFAGALKERIIKCVTEARMAADPEFVFRVSTGLAWTPIHGRSASDLKRAATVVPFVGLRKAG
jgi:diguanylate cyclase (GGDEF)-like protein